MYTDEELAPYIAELNTELLAWDFVEKYDWAVRIDRALWPCVRGPDWVKVVGSLRRHDPDANDIDIIMAGDELHALTILENISDNRDDVQRIGQRITGEISGIKYDVILCKYETWGWDTLQFTGSRKFNELMHAQARKRNLTVRSNGLWRVIKNSDYGRTEFYETRNKSEAEILTMLGLEKFKDPRTRL